MCGHFWKVWALLSIVSIVRCDMHDPRVDTNVGTFIGKSTPVEVDGEWSYVNTYLGIPYVKPPVGELRFQKPEPMEKMESLHNATDFGAVCHQFGRQIGEWTKYVTISEDCLYLNVYVPDKEADTPDGHAVMIWIYGGSFQGGGSNIYDGTYLALYGNIIVVTFNYRHGILGFLSTNDTNAPGNYGLWDQHMAFQWVHDNIGYFGGDKHRVTIAGNSAGGISTSYHSTIPKNRGLFQRVISQSGSGTIPAYRLERNVKEHTQLLATFSGCETEFSKDLLQCLRNKSTDELYAVIMNQDNEISSDEMFYPVIDHELLTKSPSYLAKIKDSNLNEIQFLQSLDVLSGFNIYEGAFVLGYTLQKEQMEHMQPTSEEMRNYFIPLAAIAIFGTYFENEVMDMIDSQYTDWTNPEDPDVIRLQLIKLLEDITFGVPAVEMAQLHQYNTYDATKKNFMYLFTDRPTYQLGFVPSWAPGAGHGDEVSFVFGLNLVRDADNWEKELSKRMIKYWSSFVKTGNPNSEDVSPYWPEYNTGTQAYIKLENNMTDSSVGHYLEAGETSFWRILRDIEKRLKEKKNPTTTDSPCVSAAFGLSVYKIATIVVSIFGIFLM